MKKELLICIPAHNEAQNIGNVLDDILALPLHDVFDVLVVDDGSTDDTRAICESRGVKVITLIYNMGYGAALKTAYLYAVHAQYEYIVQLDADGQHDACNIGRIYQSFKDGGTPPDIVIGSRFLQGSVSFPVPFHKKLVIQIFRLLIKLMTKHRITDPTSGLQGLSRKAFRYYAGFNQFAMDYPDANMVIQMLLRGFRLDEVPVVMHERVTGTSMHNGIYKPVKYVVTMSISVLIVSLRERLRTKKPT